MRTNFKPCPYFEAGFSRTAILGGNGKRAPLKLWFESLFLKQSSDTTEPIGGLTEFDIKFNILNKHQPLQFYASFEGGGQSGLPEDWSYLAGIYFPQLYKFKKLFLRTEYSKVLKNDYTHSVYTSGYTYKNYLIGHFAGRNSKSFWIESGYWFFNKALLLKGGFETVNYDQTGEREKKYYFKIKKIFNY